MGGPKGTPPPADRTRAPFPPTARIYPEVVTRTRNPVRRVAHLLLIAIGWALFALFWFAIFYRNTGGEALRTFGMLGLAFLGIGFVNLVWVWFNVGIYRRKGSRIEVPEAHFRYRHDALGRAIAAPEWDAIRAGSVVDVTIEEAQRRKLYRISRAGGPP